MIWTVLSIAACSALVVRLMLFSDDHRRMSRWYWRVVLFLVTFYAGLQVIDFAYAPRLPIGPGQALFHLGLLLGALLMRPHYLPWNHVNESENPAAHPFPDHRPEFRQRVRSAPLHGREGSPRITGQFPVTGQAGPRGLHQSDRKT